MSRSKNAGILTLNLPFRLWFATAGEPDQPDPHQVQPGRVHQVPDSHRGLHPVHRGRAAGLHRGLLPSPPLPSQAEGEAHQPWNGHAWRCYHHLPGRRSYCTVWYFGDSCCAVWSQSL